MSADNNQRSRRFPLRLLPSFRGTRQAFSKGLHKDDSERRAHVESMRTVINDPEKEKLHSWIHTNLIILDAKAQGILELYSIALAVLTLYYAAIRNDAPAFIYGGVLVGFIVVAWAIVPLARVSYVYWSSTDEFLNPDYLFSDLLRLRDERTAVIRRSVLKGVLALVIFGLLIAWDISSRLIG